MNSPVFICEVLHEWRTTQNLCQPHIDALHAERGPTGLCPWKVEKLRVLGPLEAFEVFDGSCAHCEIERQAAPGYVTPTVDYVPTTTDWRPANWKPVTV